MMHTDVVIIGAGPTGLFAIFECGMHKLSCHVFDALDKVGGQCSALYPLKPIYDIPACPAISGQDLIDRLWEQAKPFEPVLHLSEQVLGITRQADNTFIVTGSNKTSVHCKTILIAAGVGAFGPNRPPLEGLEAFEKHSVHYYVKDPAFYRAKHVVIAGGGDSAVDWALILADIAASVTVVHRRHKFKASPDNEEKLKTYERDGKIRLVVPYQLHQVQGDDGILTHVIVKALNGDELTLKADYLLPFFGLSMNLGPILEWGLGLDQNHIMIDPLTAATTQPGIYAIGDIATYPHKQKLILTGFAEAAQAAHAMRGYLFPDETRHFEYSTTTGIPGNHS